jgi:hypothetical protein
MSHLEKDWRDPQEPEGIGSIFMHAKTNWREEEQEKYTYNAIWSG